MTEGLEALRERLTALEADNRRLSDRVETLETDLQETERRLEQTETKLERTANTLEQTRTALEPKQMAALETDRITEIEAENERLRDRLEACEVQTTGTKALAEATAKRTGSNKARIEELQARELEKGAHLLAECVDPPELDIEGDHLERFTKEDGRTYVRLPEHDDPLERGGSPTLTHGDLLPIQQLARMDDEMLRSTTNALPTRLAANLWKARTDSSVGDNPWENGCKSIREYVKASDLKHWIRRQERGVSESYAKKLVSRTIDALLDLSNNRVAIRKRTERKNGLEYTERRLIIPTDAEIPGETGGSSPQPPETADVLG
ncbi:hypothetical protein OB919_20220 [Halobacteria archaeon AArc-curdl1]|uniref:Uncharacterized protein n=1 Tax=Natronosalvus hydrolyticus TaxID=2979988 RepID=A0AAP2ZBN6_9EURY|nr:hypothetical protein [Halobacteria archaeon AArc-curdl1]